MDTASRHHCVIYDGSPAKYLHALGTVLLKNLQENWRCLYLNNPWMVSAMRSYLTSGGLDVDRATEAGKLVLTCRRPHLRDGRFDPDRMLTMLEGAVEQALRDGFQGLWASGDMTWEFGSEQNFEELLDYERKLEKLFHEKPALQGICQYDMTALPRQVVEDGLCAHRSVFINEMLSRTNPYYFQTSPSLAQRAQVSMEQVRAMVCVHPANA